MYTANVNHGGHGGHGYPMNDNRVCEGLRRAEAPLFTPLALKKSTVSTVVINKSCPPWLIYHPKNAEEPEILKDG